VPDMGEGALGAGQMPVGLQAGQPMQ